jgi:hypothetical protein
MESLPAGPRVISVSRRSDIPAHYTEWLLARLRAGRCRYFHAMGHRWAEVDLRPDSVAALVFWSKNLAPLLPHLPRLADDYPFYCHLTITGHAAALEPGAPPWEETVGQALHLAKAFSPDHLVWRFDPVVLTEATPRSEVLARFRRLSAALEGATERVVVSFVCIYGKVRRRMAERGIGFETPSTETMVEMAMEMHAAAAEHGMALSACCMPELAEAGIAKAHCIDPALLTLVGARIAQPLRPAPSREGCGCHASVDIGMYDTCPTGCVFCYANTNENRAALALGEHDPRGEALREKP